MFSRHLRSAALVASLLTLTGCGLFNTKPNVEEPPVVIEDTEEPITIDEPAVEEPPVMACEPVVIEKEAACPAPVACPTIISGAVTKEGDIAIIGRIEYVDVMSIDMRKKARIDTGAETTSIDASNIVEFERDGRKWVQFTVTDRSSDDMSEVKAPVVRTVRIKQHGVDNVRRQVVELDLRMGTLRETVEVTLADRERFDYPILIGRNFLRGRAVVDVSQKYMTLANGMDNTNEEEVEAPQEVIEQEAPAKQAQGQ
ncbi:RimK/LysX family protein [Halioxenophilus aromaticivorans]|uniref:RimK/LysX family protein n=2 Tax=Halioxenophilus aromaticivorans TaxID=1306992 RepID=A0AAV3TY79_9ALTE